MIAMVLLIALAIVVGVGIDALQHAAENLAHTRHIND